MVACLEIEELDDIPLLAKEFLPHVNKGCTTNHCAYNNPIPLLHLIKRRYATAHTHISHAAHGHTAHVHLEECAPAPRLGSKM